MELFVFGLHPVVVKGAEDIELTDPLIIITIVKIESYLNQRGRLHK